MYIPPSILTVDSMRGFADAAGFAATRRYLRFVVAHVCVFCIVTLLSGNDAANGTLLSRLNLKEDF